MNSIDLKVIKDKFQYLGEGETINWDTIADARETINSLFYDKGEVARYEEMKMVDGRISFSLKDRNNSLILQLKSIEPILEPIT